MPLALSVGTNARLSDPGIPIVELTVTSSAGGMICRMLVLDLRDQLLRVLDARARRAPDNAAS